MIDRSLPRRVWSTRQLRARLDADEAGSGGGGSGGSIPQVKVTIPSAWILANAIAQEGVAFEVIAGVADAAVVLLAAAATLRFNSAPYQGDTIDTDLILSLGTDPFVAHNLVGVIPKGFWDATHDAVVPFVGGTFADAEQSDCMGQPLSLSLNGSGLTDGDSDVELTVSYLVT